LRDKYKLLSEKLEKSYDKLHRETELLIEVEEQLSATQKLSALGQLSASLAHEIKNPLSSIKGTSEILLDEFPEGHPKREFVEILLKETSRLNETVNEVLQFSRRGQQGQDKTDAVMEPLSQVIDRVRSLLSSHLQKKTISLIVKGWEAGKKFNVAGDKFSQVFLNIILNAIDAVPRKGIIIVDISRQTEGISISVTDNGPGIPDALRERIFVPFFFEQGRRNRSRSFNK
jgi:signal transduction histidine kinase